GQGGRRDGGSVGHAGRAVRGTAAQSGLRPRAGRRAEAPGRGVDPSANDRTVPTPNEETTMATMTQDDLLEAIDKMTVLELSEFIKRFEDRYGVTAAAPAAAAAAPAASGGGAAAAAAPEAQT